MMTAAPRNRKKAAAVANKVNNEATLRRYCERIQRENNQNDFLCLDKKFLCDFDISDSNCKFKKNPKTKTKTQKLTLVFL